LVNLIKIGGSLAKTPKILIELCKEIEIFEKEHKLVLVPGGSKFAEVAREMESKFKLSNETSHKIAILGMDQFGLILKNLIQNSKIFYQLNEYEKVLNLRKIPIFLPSKFFFANDPLENTWKVTSDSIALYLAKLLRINRVMIITDVDGIYDKDPEKFDSARLIPQISIKKFNEFKQESCVDSFFGKSLLNSNIECFIVNGNYPKRIKAILDQKNPVCTRIS
jgi:aspartokinase-like uncharacterized kinase